MASENVLLRSDAVSVVGLGALINSQNIQPGVNVDEIEREIVDRPMRNDHNNTDTLLKCVDELKEIAEEVGVDIESVQDEPMGCNHVLENIVNNSESESENESECESIIEKSVSGYSTDDSCISVLSDMSKRSSFKKRHKRVISGNFTDNETRRITQEQIRRDHINNVMSGMNNSAPSDARLRDAKINRLEQISQLKQCLLDDQVGCEDIIFPNMNSSLEEIEATLNVLRIKNDRNRYSTLAEEMMIGAAEIIATVFDGTREVPVVGWKPDYTGFHNTIGVKLNRMKYETSQLVGTMMENFGIGPSTRMLFELFPSFILYPKQQSMQKNTDAYFQIQKSDT